MGELYKNLAWCYEFITTGKGHEKEADFVKKMIKKYKKSKGKELLNVGCGHGWHDKFLKNNFKITGVDINKTILKFALERNPEVKYKQGDMRNFNLKRKFDVVMSLDAMMYNLSYKDLEATIKNLANHLKNDGVLIFHLDRLKENFKQYGIVSSPEKHRFFKNNTFMTYFQMDYDKNPRDTLFETSLIFLIAKKGKNLEIKTDKEVMGLFELPKIKKILLNLGFKVHLYDGNLSGKTYSKKSSYPFFVCIRK